MRNSITKVSVAWENQKHLFFKIVKTVHLLEVLIPRQFYISFRSKENIYSFIFYGKHHVLTTIHNLF